MVVFIEKKADLGQVSLPQFAPSSAVFIFSARHPCASLLDPRGEQMVKSKNRMAIDHSGTRKSHDLADLLLHLRFITMYRAPAACRFFFPERTFQGSLRGIGKKSPTFFTKQLSTAMMAATIHADHDLYRFHLMFGSCHGSSPFLAPQRT
jgi:hypothetical protein